MSAVCPACGVAVVPGYVRCPKCHAGLPHARRGGVTVDPGGTTLSSSRFPVVPVAIGLFVAGVIIAVLALRGSSKSQPAPVVAPRAVPSQPATIVPPPPVSAPAPAVAAAATGPSATAIAADLDRQLKRQRLWGTVEVVGARVDVRSGACADPAMTVLLDAAREPLHAAGVTRLRCLEQSGTVAFVRDF